MLDIKFIRENSDIIKEAARKKHIPFDVDELIKIDQERLQHLSIVEELRTEQNKVSDSIANITDQAERSSQIEKMRVLKENLKEKEEAL